METQDKTYFVGGRETEGDNATDYINTIVSMLDKLESNMLQKISKIMTDRVVTNTPILQSFGEGEV